MSARIKFDEKTIVGQVGAENDEEFLFKCFFDHPVYSVATDVESSKSLIVGSTGSGKTAILKMIEKNNRATFIDLNDMAMKHISNSDALAFLESIDADLHPFYLLLWQHVICIEFIRIKFEVDTEEKSKKVFEKIKDFFDMKNPREERAIRYLEIWKNNFWITMDENVVEFTKNMESLIKGSFGAEISRFNNNAGFSRTLSSEKRIQLQRRAKNFVSPQMLSELAEVINILKEYEGGVKHNQYILIDGLDENWVGPEMKYDLIQSLIECLKKLRRIRGLKVVVALRSDIMEKVTRENAQGRFQVEKYEDYIQRIQWDKNQLKTLINSRINHLFKRQYQSDNIFFEELFSTKVRGVDAFNYMLERTLLRPRDLIVFTNTCFENAKGSVAINETTILSAESVYSESRRRAIIGEWSRTFPAIEAMIECLDYKKRKFELKDLESDEFLSFIVDRIFTQGQYTADPIYKMLENCTGEEESVSLKAICREIFERLYLIGSVGLKVGKNDPWQWFYKSQKIISKSSIGEDTKVDIHPMLHSTCNVRGLHKS